MTHPGSHVAAAFRSRVTWLELLGFVAAAAAGVAALLYAHGMAPLARPFWLDELCCTMYAVRDASSIVDLIGYVKRYDIAPPLLHVIVWMVTRIVGSDSPLVVRSIGLACQLLALLVLYVALRRRFGLAASVAGSLAVASSPLLPIAAFDARFYNPWLLFAAAYALAFSLDEGRPSRRRDVAQAVLAISLCSIHWFGVTSLFLMAAAAFATHGRRWREGLRLVAPSIAGPIALLALSPMLVWQIRQGGEALLWVQPLNLVQIYTMARAFVLRLPVSLAIVALLADRLRGERRRAAILPILLDPCMAALLALLFMPAVLIFISMVMESVMVARYAILANLAAGPIVALAVETFGRAGRIAAVALLAAWFAMIAHRRARFIAFHDGVTQAYSTQFAQLKAANPGVPMVFQSPYVWYEVEGPLRTRASARLLWLPDSTVESLYVGPSMEENRRVMLRENKGVLNHNRVFGFPMFVSQSQLDTTPLFLLFATDADLPPPLEHQDAIAFGRRVFPNHHGERISGVVTVFRRVPR